MKVRGVLRIFRQKHLPGFSGMYTVSLLAAQRSQFGKGISTRMYPGLVVSPFAWHMMIQVPSLLPQAANLVTKGTATNVTSAKCHVFYNTGDM